ncbi:MAG: DUF1788 domain-containing protein, partial [bacterium]
MRVRIPPPDADLKGEIMAGIEGLIHSYEKYVSLPWETNLAGAQKVWFAVYNPMDERRLRVRIAAFALATQKSGHGWKHVDLTGLFARWMTANRYCAAYFKEPELLTEATRKTFEEFVITTLRSELNGEDADGNTVVAISGVASMFGFTRTSAVVEGVVGSIRGRLLVFFPGERDGSS